MKEQKTTRKIIQIALSGECILALCNDGTLWCKVTLFREWIEIDEIPQPEK
jgi:hypothetical protein